MGIVSFLVWGWMISQELMTGIAAQGDFSLHEIKVMSFRLLWDREPGQMLLTLQLSLCSIVTPTVIGRKLRKRNIEMNEEKRLNRGPVMMIVMGRVLFDENMSQTLRSNPEHRQSLPSERSQYR